MNLFVEDNRFEKLTELEDSLLKLNVVNWESILTMLESAFQRERKSYSGIYSHDVVMIFKVLILQRLINISDNQMEYQLNDRMGFMRFLGLSLGDKPPDAKTIRLSRNLTKASILAQLFVDYCNELENKGSLCILGQSMSNICL